MFYYLINSEYFCIFMNICYMYIDFWLFIGIYWAFCIWIFMFIIVMCCNCNKI